MNISIHQPAYLPWLGYFDKIKNSDLFIILDTVQYQKNSFQNRNTIISKNGEPIWLTVPLKKNKIKTIKNIQIFNEINWKKKHYESIKFNYKDSKNFKKINLKLFQFYNQEWELLNDLCYEMLKYFCNLLEIKTTIIKLSEKEDVFGKKSDLILNICKKYKASSYYSGINGKNYLDENKFKNENIKINYQNYPQKFKKYNFKNTINNNFSIIDHIMKSDNLTNF